MLKRFPSERLERMASCGGGEERRDRYAGKNNGEWTRALHYREPAYNRAIQEVLSVVVKGSKTRVV